MNKRNLLIGLAIVGYYFYSRKSFLLSPGASITTTNKRNAIITYWQTYANPDVVATDNGRFVDIINSISPGQIDTIYSYIFDYIEKNVAPPLALETAMQSISTQYNILTS